MNVQQIAQSPGFLAALIPLTRYEESLDVKISADHFSLTVTVSAAGHAPLKATGTPAALEKDLPAALAKYAQWVETQETTGEASGTRITLPGEAPAAKPQRVRQATRTKKKAKAKPRKRPSSPSFMKPMYPSAVLTPIVGAGPMTRTDTTKKLWAYIRRNGLQDKKNRRQINTDDKLRVVFGGKRQVSMFEMTKYVMRQLGNKPAKAVATPKRPTTTKTKRAAATPSASKPGKAECIADYKALKTKYGDKLTRRQFVDHAPTKRRYEKLWDNDWDKFRKEAEGTSLASVHAAAAKAPPATSKPDKPASKKPAPKSAATTKKPAKDDKRPWAVKVKGKQVGATIFEKKPGDKIMLGAGTFSVLSVDAEKREIQVELASAAPAALSSFPPTGGEPAAESKKQVPYALKTEDGKTTLGAVVKELAIGTKWGPFDRWEVVGVDHEKREYAMKDLKPDAASPAAGPSETTTEKPE